MWNGTDTKKLIRAKEKYEKIFGYDPDGEMGVEYGEGEQRKYIRHINMCIRKRKHIGELFSDCEED